MSDMLTWLYEKGVFGSKPMPVVKTFVPKDGAGQKQSFAFGKEEEGSEYSPRENVLTLNALSDKGGLSKSFEKEGLPPSMAKDFVMAHEASHFRFASLTKQSSGVVGRMQAPQLERLMIGTPGKDDWRDGSGVAALLTVSLSDKERMLRSARFSMMETWCDAFAIQAVAEKHGVPLEKVSAAVSRSRSSTRDLDHSTTAGISWLPSAIEGGWDEKSFAAAEMSGKAVLSSFMGKPELSAFVSGMLSSGRERGGKITPIGQPDAIEIASRVSKVQMASGLLHKPDI